jgi:hypothetical protein
MPNVDNFDVAAYNHYIGADVNLPWGDSMMANAWVTGQKWEQYGSLKGNVNANPMHTAGKSQC